VEIVDGRGEVPWNVLHPSEAAFLAGLTGEDRARAFARLWSLKEAYLKARRTGLSREPSSFAVRFTGEETAAVQDPLTPDARMLARTLWREAGEVCGVFSVIVAAP
jgi:phosphopantetheinyl transferase